MSEDESSCGDESNASAKEMTEEDSLEALKKKDGCVLPKERTPSSSLPKCTLFVYPEDI